MDRMKYVGVPLYGWMTSPNKYRGACFETSDLRPFNVDGKRVTKKSNPIGFRPPVGKNENT